LDWIRKHFAGRFEQLPRNSSLTIVDRNGIILVRLPNFDREGQQLFNYSYVVNAPQPGTFRSTADKNADGIARFLGFMPLSASPQGVAIAVGYPQEPALAEVRAGALRNYTLLAAVAILALGAATLAGQIFISRPLAQLLSTIERYRNGDLKARVARRSKRTEFDQIGDAFNSMADELEAALHHKDVLLRELSHRVMNSLQTISALFRLQSKSIRDSSALVLFEQSIRRIDAVALTYRRMQAFDGVESIEFGAYLSELCSNLEKSVMNARCVVRAVPLQLSPKQAIPLALIVNELVTNAVKHGATCDEPVSVELAGAADWYRLCVTSQGDLPTDYDRRERGFGMKMVSSMVDDLRGTMEVVCADHTTRFIVSFSPSNLLSTVPTDFFSARSNRQFEAG
jgi:two-component sensor histidine kinase